MKKILTLSAALMLCASMAMAQGGVNLYINNCGVGSTQNNVTNACTSNTGTAFAAYGSMVMPAVTKDMFVGAMSILDVQTSQTTIPDWWRADACRSAGFTLATDAGMGGDCPTLWDNVPAAGNNITALPGVNGAARIRFLLGAVLDAGVAYDLVGDGATETSVFKFSVLRSKSTGAGACAGCTAGACIVLNDIQLQGLNDHSFADFIDIVTPLANNYITYNAGAPACAGSTPTNNRTWGSVKALYR
jgi:hypothetical protein